MSPCGRPPNSDRFSAINACYFSHGSSTNVSALVPAARPAEVFKNVVNTLITHVFFVFSSADTQSKGRQLWSCDVFFQHISIGGWVIPLWTKPGGRRVEQFGGYSVTTKSGQDVSTLKKTRRACLVAALLITASPIALHAETSNTELAKQIAELKAQIRSMKSAISENRVETRRAVKRAPAVVVAAPASVIPEGATPVFVTASKQMQFGALTITPGGFLDMESVYRTKNLAAETSSPVNAIPFNNAQNAHYGETRLSARNTRVALLVEAPISANMLVAGYGELDFRAAGSTSSQGQTNSFSPRIRQLYSTLDNNEFGLHFLAGQAWSLVTANSKGITPRNELLPPTLDNVVLPGFDYSRTPQVRLVKDFGKKLWLGLSLESPQTAGLPGGNCAAVGPAGITANAATGVTSGTCEIGATGGDYAGQGTVANISLNRIPNIVGKVAYEASIADRNVHLEALGLFKEAQTFVTTGVNGVNGASQYTPMGGVGANISFPVVPGKLDFQAGGEYGTGFGYYTSSGLPDATVGADGKAKGIVGESGYAGLVAHVTPAIDIYAYGGIDQLQRTYTQIGATQFGYGRTIGNDNTGCNVLSSASVCNGQTHRIWQLTGGFTDKLYKGTFGEVRVAAQYSYTKRDLFSSQATAAAPISGASTDEHIVMTSMRYFPFQ